MSDVYHILPVEVFEEQIRTFFLKDRCNSFSRAEDLCKIFKLSCFYFTECQSTNEVINRKLTEFLKLIIAEEDDNFDRFKYKMKSYDVSVTCSVVWKSNYFAYRCGTCRLSPNMALCAPCFNNGNHAGHDFHMFKSRNGGTCDCGNSDVMNELGNCCDHGPFKWGQQREPPDSLTRRLKLLTPIYLKCFLFASWSVMGTTDTSLSKKVVNAQRVVLATLSFVNELLACGWAAQTIIADIMIDKALFIDIINECKCTEQYKVYEDAMMVDPGFTFPLDKVESQQLNHNCLLDAFIFVCIELRFPEILVNFLIGLLTIQSYKEVFLHSYLNHYSRMVSALMIHAKRLVNVNDSSHYMNNNIVNITVQLLSSEAITLKIMKERCFHYLIVNCLLNMLKPTLTRLDTNGNSVINCDSSIIKNRSFWPLISDLINIVNHKSAVDLFINDAEFMTILVKFLKWMQFMNFFILKEGIHIEYDTMSYFFAFNMEFEMSSVLMGNISFHYLSKEDNETFLNLANLFVTTLAEFIESLGTFKIVLVQDHSRKPLSFHLPLMRTTTCFLIQALVNHQLPLSRLLENINTRQMIRWFDETANILLGCQEVSIGYWLSNGEDIRTSKYYYTLNKFCIGFVDMDILASQICASVIPGCTVIHSLTDPTQLLRGIIFAAQPNSKKEYISNKFRDPEHKLYLEKQSPSLEAWLMNLCWLIDLRNEMIVDAKTKLRKEVCNLLCSNHIKRSDLKDALPIRNGISKYDSSDLDSILNEVANFSAPTYDKYSGNLRSGFYTLKPELWDIDYDPIFQSLRSRSKQDAVKALSNYREYYRKKENLSRPNSLWPPYRIPPPPHSEISQLDNILHCKDLTYIIFCTLYMFVNNDAIVSEDSLALIVHLILRSLLIDEPHDSLDTTTDYHKTRFPDNPYKVNNMRTNVRFNVAINLEMNDIKNSDGFSNAVKRESIISLLLTIHAKLNTERLESVGKSSLSVKSSKLLNLNSGMNESSQNSMGINCGMDENQITERQLIVHNYPLAYNYSINNLRNAKDTGLGINWGDGVDFIGYLLDLIVSRNDDNSKYLFEFIEEIKRSGVDKSSNINDRSPEQQTTDSVTVKKQRAHDRRQRLLANMVLRQKLFANAHHLDQLDVIVKDNKTEMYQCVICQHNSDPMEDKMVLLGMVCSADLLKYMEDVVPLNNKEMTVIRRKDYKGKLCSNAPILSRGIIIQTCGHVVHEHCFDQYKTHKVNSIRFRVSITCPLCRRDVHHLTPIQIQVITNPPPNSLYSSLKTQLLQSLNTQLHDIKTDIIDDHIAKNEMANISIAQQACSLLRSQLELELIVCLSVPDQYSTITKRCHWSQFISYLRTLNVDSITLINQSDSLLGTSFSHDLNRDDKDDKSKHLPFLFEVPSDLFLNFIPYIWPHEDHILHILKACIVMAYVKGMVMIGGRLTQSEYDYWCRDSAEDDDDFQKQFSLVLKRCRQVYYQESFNGFAKDTVVKETIVTDLMKCLMPLLRIASVLKLHLLKVDDVPSNFPIVTIDNAKNIEFCGEFHRLCEFLNLPLRNNSSNKDSSEQLVSMVSACVRSTMYNDFNEVVDEFIDRDLKGHKTIRLYNTTLDPLNVGNELYPPHLIELPNSYDELFNTYHSQRCNPSSKDCIHNYPENGLCLICGNLVCFICKRIPQAFGEHTNECCFGVGVIIEVNTSIIYVLVNNEASEWGSVYLDNYGEEDLELKRGRPLFINDRRLNLLKQQWLTHSFRHVLKTWRKIS